MWPWIQAWRNMGHCPILWPSWCHGPQMSLKGGNQVSWVTREGESYGLAGPSLCWENRRIRKPDGREFASWLHSLDCELLLNCSEPSFPPLENELWIPCRDEDSYSCVSNTWYRAQHINSNDNQGGRHYSLVKICGKTNRPWSAMFKNLDPRAGPVA